MPKYAVSKVGGRESCRSFFFTGYRYFSLQHYTQTESGTQFLPLFFLSDICSSRFKTGCLSNAWMNSELSSAHHKKKKLNKITSVREHLIFEVQTPISPELYCLHLKS